MSAPLSFAQLQEWTDRLSLTAETAGQAIMDVRARGFETFTKADASPVTEADRAAESLVTAAIEALTPQFPIIAEERMAEGNIPMFEGESFWLVDALDGTKEFVKGGADFTVNIALIIDGAPVFGIVHAPARGETFAGIACPNGTGQRATVTRGGTKAAISVRSRPPRVIVTGSKSHEVQDQLDKFLAERAVAEMLVVGSSIKFCLVAEGRADFYPRFSPTSEWDTAAGHAVLRAAGGRVHTFDGVELTYKKPSYLNGRFLAEACA